MLFLVPLREPSTYGDLMVSQLRVVRGRAFQPHTKSDQVHFVFYEVFHCFNLTQKKQNGLPGYAREVGLNVVRNVQLAS
jgi:hypothetical protein